MEAFFLFCILMCFLVCLAACFAGHKNNKEREAKLELMRKHPEHAAQIQQAIDMQEKQFQSQMRSAFTPQPVVKQKKSGGGMGKLVVLALCAIYIISPLDFIPDVIPALGWGDDIVAGLIGLRTLIK